MPFVRILVCISLLGGFLAYKYTQISNADRPTGVTNPNGVVVDVPPRPAVSTSPQDTSSDSALVTPDRDRDANYDVIGTLGLSSLDPSSSRPASPHGNDRAVVFVDNLDGVANLTAIDGTFISRGKLMLKSVVLADATEPHDTISSVAQIAGTTFTISGFAPLSPSRSYAVFMIFDGVPSGETTLRLRGTFSNE